MFVCIILGSPLSPAVPFCIFVLPSLGTLAWESSALWFRVILPGEGIEGDGVWVELGRGMGLEKSVASRSAG